MTDTSGPDAKPIKNAGELFTHARRRWGIEPEEVLGILGVPPGSAPRADPGNLETAYRNLEGILELRSGRVLRPEAGLGPALDEAEGKAWDALARYKFQMFGHWASVWVHLNRVGKAGRRNPFAGVVKLGREQARAMKGGEG